MRYILLVVASAILMPSLASAQCRAAVPGTSCVSVPKSATKSGPLSVGQVLQRGAYPMLMNAPYYGLPPVSGGWVYLRVKDDIYRVDWNTNTVLERVTHKASRNF